MRAPDAGWRGVRSLPLEPPAFRNDDRAVAVRVSLRSPGAGAQVPGVARARAVLRAQPRLARACRSRHRAADAAPPAAACAEGIQPGARDRARAGETDGRDAGAP